MGEAFEGDSRADNHADIIAATVLAGFQVIHDMRETTPVQDNALRDLMRVVLNQSPLARKLRRKSRSWSRCCC